MAGSSDWSSRLVRGAAAAVIALASPTHGEDDLGTLLDPEGGRPAGAASTRQTIEEVVVTAQKKVERLHDVPISMSVLDSEFLAEQHITDLREASLHIPNVQIDYGPFGVEPRMRGFTTDPLNKGFEQAVGLVVDGIPYGRGEYFQGALFDVERIEALRGPQGYLFGKNSTVGLLNLTTQNPTDELSGYLDGELGDFDRKRFAGALGGPLVPGLVNVRLSGLLEERDGLIRNTTHRVVPQALETFQDRERDGARVKLEFPSVLGANVLLAYERGRFDFTSNGAEIILMPEELRDFFRGFDPDTDFEPDNFVASEDFPWLQTRELDTVTTQVSYDFAGWALHALAGFSRLEVDTSIGDSNPAFEFEAFLDEISNQTTVELRLSSPMLAGFLGLDRFPALPVFGDRLAVPLGSTNFTTGFFFQRRELDPVDYLADVNDPVLFQIILLSGNPGREQLPPSGELSAILAQEEYVERFHLLFTETSDTFDGFGQMDWHFAGRWTLLSGMRVSFNTKHATWDSTVKGPCGTAECAPLLGAAGLSFVDERTRDEFQLAPKLGMKLDWTDDVALFATWSRSFRAGGFNTNNAQDDPSTRVFDAESVHSWELGAKMRLLDGALSLNTGIFHMILNDFQVHTLEPRATLPRPFVDNAGKLRTRGIEVDLTHLPAEWLTVRGSLGFNDTEFLEFPFGPCSQDRQNTDGDDDTRCDLAGGPLAHAPKWNITLTPAIDYPVSALPGLGTFTGFDVTSSLTVEYVDTQFLDVTLDPRTRQDSFFRLSGNVGLRDEARGWSVGLSATNLTDVITASTAGAGIAQCAGCFTQVLEEPRLFFGSMRWSF